MSDSFVEWSAIVAGAVLACAISLVLLQFGNALNLSAAHFQQEDHITATKLLMVGLWLFCVQLLASIAGGYLAGRMRAPWASGKNSPESELRDGAHGLLVWATSTLIAVVAGALIALLGAFAAQHGLNTDQNMHVPVDITRKTTIILAFGAAAGSIVSAVAAWWMGVVGGDHRDKGIVARGYVSFRRR